MGEGLNGHMAKLLMLGLVLSVGAPGQQSISSSPPSRSARPASSEVEEISGPNVNAANFLHEAETNGLPHYCAAHPGETWMYRSKTDKNVLFSGRCLSDKEKELAAEDNFVAHHQEFVTNDNNSELLRAYIRKYGLDPQKRRSYERAYRALRTTGELPGRVK